MQPSDKQLRASVMDDSNKCGKCLYWRRKGNTMTGKCHRHSPKRIPSKDSGYINDWAMTNEDDFCGDFSPGTPGAGKAEKPKSMPIKEIFKPKERQLPIEDRQPRQ
jgi:hypothetical protein